MLEQLKKNWFVLVVAALLLGATGFYIQDQAKNTVNTKKIKGEQVVFSIAGENYFVKDFQKDMDDVLGDSALYQIFRRELLSNIETSQDIQSDAKFKSESFITYIKQSEGQKGLDQINLELEAMGYAGIDELSKYYENEAKYQELVSNKFMENYDTLFKKEVEETKPRMVSHILVKIEDPKNPTEAELEKIKKVDEALEKGTPFDEIATQYSDDTGSQKQGGNLGVVSSETQFVEPFLDAMLKLEKDEVSGWVETTHGRHIIKVTETDFERLLKDPEYFTSIAEEKADVVNEAIWEQAEKLNFEFANADVENRIKRVLGLIKEEN